MMSRAQWCTTETRASSKLSSYCNPAAERLDHLRMLSPKPALILGMNNARKIFHMYSSVASLPCARATLDGFTCENNQWVPGWIRCHHGPRWPNARALAVQGECVPMYYRLT
eukprot:5841180-Pyramimonas_sp.AAC.2